MSHLGHRRDLDVDLKIETENENRAKKIRQDHIRTQGQRKLNERGGDIVIETCRQRQSTETWQAERLAGMIREMRKGER